MIALLIVGFTPDMASAFNSWTALSSTRPGGPLGAPGLAQKQWFKDHDLSSTNGTSTGVNQILYIEIYRIQNVGDFTIQHRCPFPTGQLINKGASLWKPTNR